MQSARQVVPNARVPYPLSAPTVIRRAAETRSSIVNAASRPAVPVACDSTTSTTSPVRFSMGTWPANDSCAACPSPVRANSASGSVVDTWVALERRSPRKSFHGFRPPAPVGGSPSSSLGRTLLRETYASSWARSALQCSSDNGRCRLAHHRPEELVEGTAPDVQVEEPPEEHSSVSRSQNWRSERTE